MSSVGIIPDSFFKIQDSHYKDEKGEEFIIPEKFTFSVEKMPSDESMYCIVISVSQLAKRTLSEPPPKEFEWSEPRNFKSIIFPKHVGTEDKDIELIPGSISNISIIFRTIKHHSNEYANGGDVIHIHF